MQTAGALVALVVVGAAGSALELGGSRPPATALAPARKAFSAARSPRPAVSRPSAKRPAAAASLPSGAPATRAAAACPGSGCLRLSELFVRDVDGLVLSVYRASSPGVVAGPVRPVPAGESPAAATSPTRVASCVTGPSLYVRVVAGSRVLGSLAVPWSATVAPLGQGGAAIVGATGGRAAVVAVHVGPSVTSVVARFTGGRIESGPVEDGWAVFAERLSTSAVAVSGTLTARNSSGDPLGSSAFHAPGPLGAPARCATPTSSSQPGATPDGATPGAGGS